MDENGEINADAAGSIADKAIELVDVSRANAEADPFMNGEIKTLDGGIAGDEFAADAINYQILLGKIDGLLERLKLDA